MYAKQMENHKQTLFSLLPAKTTIKKKFINILLFRYSPFDFDEYDECSLSFCQPLFEGSPKKIKENRNNNTNKVYIKHNTNTKPTTNVINVS